MSKNISLIFLITAIFLTSACYTVRQEPKEKPYFRLVKYNSKGIAYEYQNIDIEKLKAKAEDHCSHTKKTRLEGIYRITNGHKLAKFICEY